MNMRAAVRRWKQAKGDIANVTKHQTNEPRNYREATESIESAEWQAAMQEKIGALRKNETWELVPLRTGRQTVGCKLTYKRKANVNGEIVRHKARLVAQGYSLKFGQDYDGLFAPVIKQATFWTILTVASKQSMIVKDLDIKNAYLHAELQEDIYMKQPPGFIKGNGLVFHLKKSLYGLKQSARAWNTKINGTHHH